MDVKIVGTAIVMTGSLNLKSGNVADYTATMEEEAVMLYVRRALGNKSRRAQGGPVVAKVTIRPAL